MALNFPASPTNGQVYYDSTSGNQYVYVSASTKWIYSGNSFPFLQNTSGTVYNGSLYFPTGSLGIGRSSAVYALDVVGSINASAVLVNGSAITVDLTPANSYTNTSTTSTNNYTSATYSTLTQLGQNWAVTNAAFGIANTALQNTTGVVFNGKLYITSNVSIGNTAASPSNFDIFGNYTMKTVAASSGTIDCSQGNYYTFTASGGVTWSFTNVPTNRTYGFIFKLTNGGTGTQVWPAAVKWSGGTAPTLTTSGIDILTFVTDDGGTTWKGVASMTGV